MRSYDEAVLRMAAEAMDNYFGGSMSHWSMLSVNANAIAYIYEKDVDDVWDEAEKWFTKAFEEAAKCSEAVRPYNVLEGWLTTSENDRIKREEKAMQI